MTEVLNWGGETKKVVEDMSPQLEIVVGSNTLRVISPKVLRVTDHWVDYTNAKGDKTTMRIICPKDCPLCKRQKSGLRFAMLVYSYATKSVKIWEYSYGIFKKINNVVAIPTYKDITTYDLTIEREGTGLNTKYPSIIPGEKTELSAEIKDAIAKSIINIEEEYAPSTPDEVNTALSKLPPVPESSKIVDVGKEVDRFFK